MFNNKKGVAEIITTILIILLVLAVIVIVWQVIVPLVTQTTQQITTDCTTIRLAIQSPNKTTNSMIIKRNVGVGTLQAIKVILVNTTGTFTYTVAATDLNELGTKTITSTDTVGSGLWNSSGSNFISVNIAAIVTANQVLCPEISSTPTTLQT